MKYLITLLLLTSCAGPRGHQGVQGEPGIDGDSAPDQTSAVLTLQAKVAELEIQVAELQEKKCKRGRHVR